MRVATLHSNTELRIWDQISGECKFSVKTKRGLPVMSPDGRLLAFVVGDSVCLWDIATSSVVATHPAERNSRPQLAFDSTGRVLGIQSFRELTLLDLTFESSPLRIDFKGEHPGFLRAILSSEYLLLGDFLYDMGLQAAVWRYTGHQMKMCGKEACFLVHSQKCSALTIAVLPDAAAQAKLTRVADDPNLLALGTGMSVAVDVSGVASADRNRIRDVLQQRAVQNGLTVDPQSEVRFVATVTKAQPRTIWIEERKDSHFMFGPFDRHPQRTKHGFERTVHESITRLEIIGKNGVMWSREVQSRPPQRMYLLPDETVDAALLRYTGPYYQIFETDHIPKTILRQQDGDRVVGTSVATVNGLRAE